MADQTIQEFIKDNFRPLKTKENAPILMGRATYDWVLEQEKKKNFSHLTVATVEEIIIKHGLKKVDFEDGKTYIVHPHADRDIMVSYYAEESEHESQMTRTMLKPLLSGKITAEDKVAAQPEGEKYLVSESALARIVPEFTPADDPETAARLACDITTAEVADALGRGAIRYHYEDAEVHILDAEEEPGDSNMYTSIFPAALPGTEVSMQQLDASQRTALDGQYRDTAQESSHSVEHKITRSQ